MEKIINKMRQILEFTDDKTRKEILEALEKVLPENKENPKVKVVVGWAAGNEEDPGNHCNLIIKVD